MRAKGGCLVAETLQANGVSWIFGMEDPIEVFHALDRSVTRSVTVHDEKHAAIMAHAYAQVTGRPGICTSTFGPGATNLVTGLLEALRSSVPVIALVQDHPLSAKGRNASSELDHVVALTPYVKAVLRIDTPDQGPDMVRRAFRIATSGRPGPVALLCPTDVMSLEGDGDPYGVERYMHVPSHRGRPATADIVRAAELLAAARRPLIVAGGGSVISGAFAEVRALAERFDAPVATTMTGKGAIAEHHPLAAGVLGTSTGGLYGRGKISNTLLAEADVVCILGSRTGQICYNNWTTPGSAASVIHLDIDPQEIDRNFAVTVPLQGDVRDTLRDLLSYCDSAGIAQSESTRAAQLARQKDAWLAELAPVAGTDARPMRPERVVAELNRFVDAQTLIVTDASYSTGWAMSQMEAPVAGRFMLSPRGTASIGWGLAAAIGAKLADPARDVICVTGDGGFGYVINELETAARYRVNLLVVVFNNGTLGFQRHWEEKAIGRAMDCDFLDVDYSEVSRALKGGGERVTDPSQLAAAIARGKTFPGPYVIDAIIDPEAAAPIVGFDKPIAEGAYH
ncbi:thiamine pyrophosphate-binding protein [Comamonadaceae bacterium G21597-S1]|nr:thiamine pyrophosphate-binding protein [Comamonadaceae bacterium G21597-S1]